MLAHIVRRIVATIPVMAIVALFVFSLLYIAPGDPAAVIAGDQASPEDIEKIRIGLGLDRPFVVGYLLAYVFALQLDWFPVQGYTPIARGFWPWLENLVLPAVALGCVYIALIARITRASMLEVLQQDYIRTARSKGMGQGGILFVHALKNAAVPIVTVIGIGVALLIGGAVVTESVFPIPGLGRLTIDAIVRRDYPLIQGIVLLFSFVYVLVNLAVDVLYTLLDPRIRY